MIPALRKKIGVSFSTISPAGFRIIAALWLTSKQLGRDLVITSGTDGAHSGTDDPHHMGSAFDVRTYDIADKPGLLHTLMGNLCEDSQDSMQAQDGGYVTRYFFGWIENAGQENEHLHVQKRRNLNYPPDSSV